MTVQIKTPCRDGANDKTHTKITSHKYCTKNRLVGKPLCDNYQPQFRSNTMKFKEFIYNLGLGHHEIIFDEQIHRIRPPGGKSKSAWYIAFQNLEFEAGVAGDWAESTQENFCSIRKSELTLQQRRWHDQQMKKNAEKNRINTINRHLNSKKEVGKLWGQATKKELDSHPYLIKKQIKPLSIRKNFDKDIVIPIYDANHVLWNLQTIKKNGFKLFHKGGKIKECYHPIGFFSNTLTQLILCEGWSTAMSIYQATGVATAACFSAGNLESVAITLRNKYQSANIVIAGDEDQFKPVNIGRIKASLAAKKINAIAIFPKFKDSSAKPTDFNDLYCLEGLKVVRDQFAGVCDVF